MVGWLVGCLVAVSGCIISTVTEQYGFRLGLRTDNATYKLTTEILSAMNNKLLVGGIFCDLEKAFGCVNHDILLYKLKFNGISDKALQLYQSYVGNRYCRTEWQWE